MEGWELYACIRSDAVGSAIDQDAKEILKSKVDSLFRRLLNDEGLEKDDAISCCLYAFAAVACSDNLINDDESEALATMLGFNRESFNRFVKNTKIFENGSYSRQATIKYLDSFKHKATAANLLYVSATVAVLDYDVKSEEDEYITLLCDHAIKRFNITSYEEVAE